MNVYFLLPDEIDKQIDPTEENDNMKGQGSADKSFIWWEQFILEHGSLLNLKLFV